MDCVAQVRRGALLTFNCLAHNKPFAIREMLGELLPLLYGETAKRAELIHQVRDSFEIPSRSLRMPFSVLL